MLLEKYLYEAYFQENVCAFIKSNRCVIVFLHQHQVNMKQDYIEDMSTALKDFSPKERKKRSYKS